MSIEIQDNDIDVPFETKSMFSLIKACLDSKRIKNNATSYTVKYDRNIRIRKSNSTNKRHRHCKSSSENYISSHASDQASSKNEISRILSSKFKILMYV